MNLSIFLLIKSTYLNWQKIILNKQTIDKKIILINSLGVSDYVRIYSNIGVSNNSHYRIVITVIIM